MLIRRQPISRRTVLKGMGVTVSIPLLEAMLPTRGQAAQPPAARPRLIAIEMVHGSAGATAFGQQKNLWSPAEVGSEFDVSSTSRLSATPT